MYVVVPYTRTYADDYGSVGAVIVAADSADAAIDYVRDAVQDLDRSLWGYAADFTDSVEHAGDDCYYVCRECQCGDEGCHDDDSTHEQETELVTLDTADVQTFDRFDAAQDRARVLSCATEELFADIRETDDPQAEDRFADVHGGES